MNIETTTGQDDRNLGVSANSSTDMFERYLGRCILDALISRGLISGKQQQGLKTRPKGRQL
jgi:hypothetical protein